MRILDSENDQTRSEITLFLTTSELAQLYGLLGSMVNDIRAKEIMLNDDSFDHTLKVFRYSPSESVGFSSRHKRVLEHDE